MYNKKCLALIIAGGKGERLFPLTRDRTKPSVPFGGKYRIIDFVLSNLINSGIYSIYVTVQYKSQSLIEHIRLGWRRSGLDKNHFITVVPAQMRTEDSSWYKGTADAIFQNVNLILDSRPDLVAVFAADHIYRMDIRQMMDFHIRKKADVTIATLPVSVNEAHKFGIAQADKNGRIRGFTEKPKSSKALLPKRSGLYASMGNYIFKTEILLEALLKDAHRIESEHDFGKSILPHLIKTNKVFAYSFSQNLIPGIKPDEDKFFWRDVGNLESYWAANMALLGKRPRLDLDNSSWPIMTAGYDGPPSRVISGDIKNSIIGEGAFINNAAVHNSVVGRGAVIEEGSHIQDSIIMGFTRIGKGVKIKRAIVDRFNLIEKGAEIGCRAKGNQQRYFVDKDSGIVVLARGGRDWP